MTDTNTLTKCLEFATSAMQFMEGKEHLFGIAKMLLVTLILGGTG